jgi:hypothetical protein
MPTKKKGDKKGKPEGRSGGDNPPKPKKGGKK